MSRARSFSKLINKSNYISHRGTSSVNDLDPETDVATSISSNPIPAFVGMIGAFSMATTTEWKTANRWIVCDGSAISRTVYSDLFTVVGTTWGVGDGSSTFNLPDLRGEFLRGFDDGAGNDPDAASRTGGNVVGSSQSNMVTNHVHWIESWAGYNGSSGSYNPNNQGYGGAGPYGNNIRSRDISDDSTQSNKNVAGGNETRPRNKYVQYCIKY
jgi:microcystin-dependent protein